MQLTNRILCYTLNRAVDVYFLGWVYIRCPCPRFVHSQPPARSTSRPAFSYDPANLPFYRYVPESLLSLGTFEVDHSIDYPSPYMVPFDSYSLTATAFVIEKATNESVPIVTFTAGEATDNFIISSRNMSNMRNKFTYNPGTGSRTIEVGSGMIEVKAKRSSLAQAFTICMLFINWALTIGSMYITITLLARKEKMDAAVLLLPVSIVLTIPTLRSLYVGTPPFGIFIGKFWFIPQFRD